MIFTSLCLKKETTWPYKLEWQPKEKVSYNPDFKLPPVFSFMAFVWCSNRTLICLL